MSNRTCKLADIAMVFNGKTPSQEEQRNDGFPVLKIKDVSDDGRFVGYFDSYVSFDLAKEFAAKVICSGDTLILNAAHNADYVGSKIYFAEASVVGSLPTGEWLLIRPNAQKGNARYLNFWLQTMQVCREIKDLVKGIHLYPKDVANLTIHLPPLLEQKRIATILEKADRLRRQRRYALELSNTYLQSVFLEMFGDPVTNPKGWNTEFLGNKIAFITSGSRGWARYYTNQGAMFLRIQNVGMNQLLLDDMAYVQVPDTAEGRRTQVRSGDLLLSITADLGRTAVIRENFPEAYINQHLALLRLKELNPVFLAGFISTPGGKAQITQLDRGGVKSGLNFDDIRGYHIFVPPSSLQQKFARIVQKFERLRVQQCEAERQAEHLFQSLLYQAFEGNGGWGSGIGRDGDVEDGVQSSVVDSQLSGTYVQLQMKY
jgi:type I restriction enzyme S subunit